MTDKGRLVEILKNRYGIHESTEDLKVVKSPFKEIFIGESACAYIYSKDFNVDRISFWYKLYEHGLPVPEIKTPLSGGMFTRLNDKIVVVSEVLPSSQELWDEDYTKLGKIMAGLHSFGEDYARSKTNLEEWYSQGFDKFLGMDIDDPKLSEFATNSYLWRAHVLSKFYKFFLTGESFSYSIYLCRDFKHGNLVKTNEEIIVTDFDFAGIELPATETVRFLVEILIKYPDKGKKLAKKFMRGYKSVSPPEFLIHKYSVPIYLKYLLFNTFPLYLDTDPDKKIKLLRERNTFLQTLLENYNFLQELFGGEKNEYLSKDLEQLEKCKRNL